MADAVAGPGRSDRPPILTLLGLIDRHRGAFEYDWRTRFGCPFTDVPGRMSWGEAWRLTQQLLTDTSSHVTAAVNEWAYAWPREAFVLADLYDLQHKSKAKKGKTPKPYPRPNTARAKRMGVTHHSQRTIRAALAARGH